MQDSVSLSLRCGSLKTKRHARHPSSRGLLFPGGLLRGAPAREVLVSDMPVGGSERSLPDAMLWQPLLLAVRVQAGPQALPHVQELPHRNFPQQGEAEGD